MDVLNIRAVYVVFASRVSLLLLCVVVDNLFEDHNAQGVTYFESSSLVWWLRPFVKWDAKSPFRPIEK